MYIYIYYVYTINIAPGGEIFGKLGKLVSLLDANPKMPSETCFSVSLTQIRPVQIPKFPPVTAAASSAVIVVSSRSVYSI